MQLRYVFSELRQGLRRNLSMHVAVVLTLFVSLTLVGLGFLLNKQADRAAEQCPATGGIIDLPCLVHVVRRAHVFPPDSWVVVCFAGRVLAGLAGRESALQSRYA